MRYLILFLLAVALVALTLLVAGQLGLLRGKAPDDLGVKEGKLKRISKTANSVSSQASLWTDHPMIAYAQIEPLAYSGDGKAAMRQCFDAVTVNPAKLMHLEGYGLQAGCHADFVLLQARDPVEAIRLRAPRLKVFKRGKVIAETAPVAAHLHLPGRPATTDWQN